MHKNNICRFADFGQVKKYCRFATLGKSKKYCRFADFGQVKKYYHFADFGQVIWMAFNLNKTPLGETGCLSRAAQASSFS